MAIVGTAYVRLRIIGDKLKKDIGDSVSKAVEASSADLDKVGKDIGSKISESTSKEVERSLGSQMGRISDDIGDAIGRRMAENMGKSLRTRLAQPFKDGFARLKPLVSREGSKLGEAFTSFKDKISKTFNGKGGGGLGGILMAAIGPIVTVLPSVLAGAGAVIGAYAATAVTAVALIGPAAAGASVAAVGAFSAIKISAGLLGLAMKFPSDALDDFQKRAETFKGLIAAPIQEGLFSGLNAAMRITTPLVRDLQPLFRDLGTIVGDLAINFADALRRGEMFDRIGRILSTNNQFIRDAGTGVSDLGLAFIILLDRLSPVTREIGSMIGQFGDWALRAMEAASASGELDSWINRMWISFTRLIGIVVDFGVGIYNVFKAAQPAAGNMMLSLEGIARRFREWTGDEANQQRMIIFFEKMRTITAQVNGILGDLVTGALRGLENTNVDSLSRGLTTLADFGPPLAQMFRSIQEAAGPKLLDAFQSLADIITNLANSGALGTMASAFANLMAVIAQLLAIPGVGQLLGWIGALAALGSTAMMVVKVLGFLWRGLQPVILILRILGIGISILVGAFGAAAVAIAAAIAVVIGGLIYFFGFTETGRAIIGAVWEWIKNAITTSIDGIVAAFHWVVSALQSAWTWIQEAATGIWNAIKTAFEAVQQVALTVWSAIVTGITWYINMVLLVVTTVFNAILTVITTVWNAVLTVITTVWNAIWGFLQPIIMGIWGFIQAAFDGIRTVIEVAMNIINEIWSRIWPLLMLPIRIWYGLVLLIWEALQVAIAASLEFLSNLISTVWDAILGFVTAANEAISSVVSAVWNAISSFVMMVLNALGAFIRMVWQGILDAVTWSINAVRTVVTNVWNAIWGFIQPILQAIRDFIINAWNVINTGIRVVMDVIWGIITSVWNNVSNFINGVMSAINGRISTAWGAVTGAIRNAMNDVWGIIQSIWNNITGFLDGAMSRISTIVSNVWGALRGAGSGVVDGLKAAVNAVIGAVNGAIGGINSVINTANKLPGPDIPTISPIPRLAKGGTVSPRGGGTLAMIAEAGRPERVEPLDPQGLSKRDRAMIEFLAGGAGGAPNVNVYLGTRELIELVDVVVEEKQDGLADRVLTGTKG